MNGWNLRFSPICIRQILHLQPSSSFFMVKIWSFFSELNSSPPTLFLLVVEPTPLKNMLVKLEIFPRDRGEIKKSLSCHHAVFLFLASKNNKKSKSRTFGQMIPIFLDLYRQLGITWCHCIKVSHLCQGMDIKKCWALENVNLNDVASFFCFRYIYIYIHGNPQPSVFRGYITHISRD